MPHLVHLDWLSTAGTVLKLDAQEQELQAGLDPVKGELLCHHAQPSHLPSSPHSLISPHHSHSLGDLALRKGTMLFCYSCLLPISQTRRAEDVLGPCLRDRQMAMLPSCRFILLSPTHILGLPSSSAHPS